MTQITWYYMSHVTSQFSYATDRPLFRTVQFEPLDRPPCTGPYLHQEFFWILTVISNLTGIFPTSSNISNCIKRVQSFTARIWPSHDLKKGWKLAKITVNIVDPTENIKIHQVEIQKIFIINFQSKNSTVHNSNDFIKDSNFWSKITIFNSKMSFYERKRQGYP